MRMSEARVALITGITGQDCMILAHLLLAKGYAVHGLLRRSTSPDSQLDRLRSAGLSKVKLHFGDMTDPSSLMRVMSEVRPQEVYNLAAQSHVQFSFEMPVYTSQVNAMGTLHLLEAIRVLGLGRDCRFYQASTSELFGGNHEAHPLDERARFAPHSPYAIAKQFAFQMTVHYREAYGLHASNGILFNHEGKLRGENFVTRKITKAAAQWALGARAPLALGNLNAQRDWGDARDYVRGMWLMLQQPEPDDYVLATGISRSVREFAETAFAIAGVRLVWTGEGPAEMGLDNGTGAVVVKVDPKFFRPTDASTLRGNADKAKRVLGWRPEISFERMVQEMVEFDITRSRQRLTRPIPAAAQHLFS